MRSELKKNSTPSSWKRKTTSSAIFCATGVRDEIIYWESRTNFGPVHVQAKNLAKIGPRILNIPSIQTRTKSYQFGN